MLLPHLLTYLNTLLSYTHIYIPLPILLPSTHFLQHQANFLSSSFFYFLPIILYQLLYLLLLIQSHSLLRFITYSIYFLLCNHFTNRLERGSHFVLSRNKLFFYCGPVPNSFFSCYIQQKSILSVPPRSLSKNLSRKTLLFDSYSSQILNLTPPQYLFYLFFSTSILTFIYYLISSVISFFFSLLFFRLILFLPALFMLILFLNVRATSIPISFSFLAFALYIFLVDSCFIMFKLKEKMTMNFYLIGSNATYSNDYYLNNFIPTYYYPTFDMNGVYTAFIAHESLQNFQIPYTSELWYPTKVEIPNIKECERQVLEGNSQENEKSSTQLTNQRKNKNAQKQLESAKKNCESNLVNQFLSYFSSFNNSSAMIGKALKKMKMDRKLLNQKDYDEATLFFCKQVSIVNSRRERKYVNKTLLMNYFSVQKLDKYMPDILQKVAKFDLLTKEQFCELFRRCCYNFFRTISVSSVTSSAKLHKISRPEHIKRRRMIVEKLEKV